MSATDPFGDQTLPGDPGAPGLEPTTQIPVIDTLSDGGIPPIYPPGAPVDPDEVPEEPVPWYKKPGPIAALIVAVLAIAGLVAWLVLGGDDEEEASATSTFLVFETSSETGADIDVGFLVTVEGPVEAATSFVWLRPDGVPPGETAGDTTGTDGRVAFEWEPDETVADPAAWQSTVTALAQVPPGWTPPGPIVDCVVRPFDGPVTSVAMNIVLDSNDDTIDRTATLSFPNHTFAAGDSVTCTLIAGAPTPTTVVETTVVDTTVVDTTVVDTTDAPTTAATTTSPQTTVPPTTAAPTTVPPSTTTTTIDIEPPLPTESLWDVVVREDELSEFEQLVLDAGFDDELNDPDLTLTIFAPTNDAVTAARESLEAGSGPVNEKTLNELLLAHAADGRYTLADLLDLDPPELEMLFGGPQPIATASTPYLAMIGDAHILYETAPASNGNLFMIDKVLTPVP